MRTLTTRTWNPLNLFDAFDGFFTPYEKFDFMKTDVKETEENYILDVELAGFEKKDLSVSYENKYLTVKATRENKIEENEKYIRKERSLDYSRSYFLDGIDENAIKAKYESGILTVICPKLSAKKVEKPIIEIE